MLRTAAIGFALWIVAASPATSHHSITGQFDLSRRISLRGTIARVEWINPHVFVHLDVAERGPASRWALSTVPLAMMRKAGITPQALAGRRGETVVVDAYPAIDPSKTIAWVKRITYEDGHFLLLFD